MEKKSNGAKAGKETFSSHHLVNISSGSSGTHVTFCKQFAVTSAGRVEDVHCSHTSSHNLWLMTSVIINPSMRELIHSTLRIFRLIHIYVNTELTTVPPQNHHHYLTTRMCLFKLLPLAVECCGSVSPLWGMNGLVSVAILCPSRRSGVCAAPHRSGK